MCIIVAKPKNVAMPNMDTLAKCFEHNDDGAGIMFNHDGMVHGYKGLMTFDQVKAKIAEIERDYGNLKPKGVVLHFRIGTHGSNIPANTHPFPLGRGYDSMRKLSWVADQGFAHNGIIYKYTSHDDVRKHNVSDTMVFGKHCASPMSQWTDLAKDSKARDILDLICNGKLAFMNGDGVISTCGHFVRSKDALYSNSTFRQAKTVYSYTPRAACSYSSYYDNDDWYDSLYKNRPQHNTVPCQTRLLVSQIAPITTSSCACSSIRSMRRTTRERKSSCLQTCPCERRARYEWMYRQCKTATKPEPRPAIVQQHFRAGTMSRSSFTGALWTRRCVGCAQWPRVCRPRRSDSGNHRLAEWRRLTPVPNTRTQRRNAHGQQHQPA